MTATTTTINTPGSNTYTAPTTLVSASVSVSVYGADGDGEVSTGVTTTGGRSGLVTATIPISPGGTLTCWVGDVAGHGYHPGGAGTASGGGGQTGFHGGGSSAILSGSTVLVEAAGGGGAGGNAYTGFGSARGGYGGHVFGSGYHGGVTPHTACFGGGGGGGGGHQGNGSLALNTHTGFGGTVVGGGGDSGLNQTGVAGGGGGGAGGSSYTAAAPLVTGVRFSDATGTTTLGSVTLTARVADPPLVPTLTGPYNGMYVDCTQAVTFSWAYNRGTDSGSQNAYALRVALDGGAYQYWNATTHAFQSSVVWNSSSSASVVLPVNVIANGHAVTWSVATAESHFSLQGPFAVDFTFISGTTVKWQLVDPVTNEAYGFEINPNTGGSLTRQKSVSNYATSADDSVIVLYEGADSPQMVEVSGTLLSQGQYTNLIYWYSKRRQVLLIDDLGRHIWVYFTSFTPTRKWTKQSPWRHDWSAQFYVVGPQAVTAR